MAPSGYQEGIHLVLLVCCKHCTIVYPGSMEAAPQLLWVWLHSWV